MFEINKHETLATPYEIIAEGHVVARMADISHALIIMKELQLEGFTDIYLADDGRVIYEPDAYQMRNYTAAEMALLKQNIIEIVLEGGT
jgi:hypothetical protein